MKSVFATVLSQYRQVVCTERLTVVQWTTGVVRAGTFQIDGRHRVLEFVLFNDPDTTDFLQFF